MEVIQQDYREMSAENVKGKLQELIGLPEDTPFTSLNNKPFHGTVPKGHDVKVYEAALKAQTIASPNSTKTLRQVKNQFQRFRTMDFFRNEIPTDKPLYGYKKITRRIDESSKVIWIVSAYEDFIHERHLEILKGLAEIWRGAEDDMKLYSIEKDIHEPTVHSSYRRRFVALLVINFNKII